MGIPALTNAELAELQTIRPEFVQSTPLFYYILKEAQFREDGLGLGPCGRANRGRGIRRIASARP